MTKDKGQMAKTNDKGQITKAIEVVKRKLPEVAYKLNEPMRNHTSFKIGGAVRVMYFPESASQLTELCDILSENGVTPLILGNGSNILASDDELDLVAINTSGLSGIELVNTDDTDSQGYGEIAVEAGVLLSKLAVFACECGLTGLEFAHGIPGTVGGAVMMNAGAYDGEMKDVVSSTTAYSMKHGKYSLTAADHEFSYRHSCFSDTNDTVISTKIRLPKGDKKSIQAKMDELGARRREKQPLDLPSGGSTFKRPKDGYAAALIEQAGLKGYTIGGAQVSEKHAGFVVNRGDATFADVMAVIEHVQGVVLERFGVQLEPEIKIVE